MTDQTDVTVLIATPTENIEVYEQPGNRDILEMMAEAIFQDSGPLASYYHGATLNIKKSPPVVKLNTDTGAERVNTRLAETAAKRSTAVEEILRLTRDADTVTDAASSYDLFDIIRRLHWAHPEAAQIYDGTGYSFGLPILNEPRVGEITAHNSDKQLWAVELVATY